MSDTAPADVDAAAVPRALGRLRIALNNSYSRTSRSLGLSPAQAELLVYAARPRSITELADLLGCDRSNVSHLVNRTKARGLIDRCPDENDGRVSRVALTEKGEALKAELIERLEALTADLRAGWEPGQAAATTALLTEIAEAVEPD